MRYPLIIDTDPGVDDAVALIIAFQNQDVFDVRLVTTAVGNMPFEISNRNTLFLVEKFAPYHVDVAEGKKETVDKVGIKKTQKYSNKIEGISGLGNFVPPEPSQELLPDDAVEAMYKALSASKEKIIICELGSSVNIAKLVTKYPEIKDKIEYAFIMGGSIDGRGNVKPYAEFNVYHDPVAFDIMLKSGVQVVLSPLHLGLESAMEDEAYLSRPITSFKEQFIHDLIDGAFEPMQVGKFALHDTHVIMGLLNPSLYEFKNCDITVSCEKENYGQTFVTLNPKGKHKVQLAKNAAVVRDKLFEEIYRKADNEEKKIAVIGSINTDFTFKCNTLPAPSETVLGESFEIKYGGKGANEAVASARLGAMVSLFGKIGNDMFSKANLDNLKKEKINVSHVEVEKGISGGSAGISVGSGTNSIIVVPGANAFVDRNYIDRNKEQILQNDIFCLQLEIPFDTVDYLISLLAKEKKTIIFNPSPIQSMDKKLLKKCSYIIVNEVEIEKLPDFKSREQLLKAYKGKLILTCGGDGVYFYEKRKVQHIPSLQIENIIDTTGAGDTFLGALAVALSENKTLGEAVEFANICAGLKIQKLGAQTGMPRKNDVVKYIKTQQKNV